MKALLTVSLICALAATANAMLPTWPTAWVSTRFMYYNNATRNVETFGQFFYDWGQQALMIENPSCWWGDATQVCNIIERPEGTFAIGLGVEGGCCYGGPWGSVPPNYMNQSLTGPTISTLNGRQAYKWIRSEGGQQVDAYYQLTRQGASGTSGWCPDCGPGMPYGDEDLTPNGLIQVFHNAMRVSSVPASVFAVPAGCAQRPCASMEELLAKPPTRFARRL